MCSVASPVTCLVHVPRKPDRPVTASPLPDGDIVIQVTVRIREQPTAASRTARVVPIGPRTRRWCPPGLLRPGPRVSVDRHSRWIPLIEPLLPGVAVKDLLTAPGSDTAVEITGNPAARIVVVVQDLSGGQQQWTDGAIPPKDGDEQPNANAEDRQQPASPAAKPVALVWFGVIHGDRRHAIALGCANCLICALTPLSHRGRYALPHFQPASVAMSWSYIRPGK